MYFYISESQSCVISNNQYFQHNNDVNKAVQLSMSFHDRFSVRRFLNRMHQLGRKFTKMYNIVLYIVFETPVVKEGKAMFWLRIHPT